MQEECRVQDARSRCKHRGGRCNNTLSRKPDDDDDANVGVANHHFSWGTPNPNLRVFTSFPALSQRGSTVTSLSPPLIDIWDFYDGVVFIALTLFTFQPTSFMVWLHIFIKYWNLDTALFFMLSSCCTNNTGLYVFLQWDQMYLLLISYSFVEEISICHSKRLIHFWKLYVIILRSCHIVCALKISTPNWKNSDSDWN